MNGSAADAAAAETVTGYGFRRACEANAFDQCPLIPPSKLSDEARDRGIQRAGSFLEELERFDRGGAFRPVLFEVVDAEGAEAIVFRDERDYVPWSEYEVPEWGRAVPRPRYSPWQLLYLNDAVELPKISVSIEWLLDDERRAALGPNWRTLLGRQLKDWRQLDRAWRDVLLVLIRLQGWYGPSVKGTLLKGTVTLVRHPESGEYVDPRVLEPPFEPHRVLAELGLTLQALKDMHQRLAVHGMMHDGDDPLRSWHMLSRMAPAKQRAKLRGRARRAQDAYDAAEMLRRFHFDLTGELLPNPDVIFDISDKSWRKRLFGKWPTLQYTRADLAVELRLRDLHPHQVHIVTEGETEKIVCERVLEELVGMPLNDTGVSVQRLHGVGNAVLSTETLQALKAFPRYLILVADNEGDMKRQVERLQQEGVLTDETTFLWDTSFEEANFSDEELVAMIAAIGTDRGATLTLDVATLRTLYEAHRVRAGNQAKGLTTFALDLARRPDYGSVVASKTELAERMADLILDDLRQHDAEEVLSRRPIASILISVFRVT
jgi:Overcoming lysogenization defect protein-like, TOPRIM domain